jgi:phosphoribosylformylglycinamidine synthase PurS subunit
MEYEVLVELKGEVLDPEGRAIAETLRNRGVNGVDSVLVAKRYVVSLAKSAANPDSLVQEIAASYLANPVSQVYSIKRLTP